MTSRTAPKGLFAGLRRRVAALFAKEPCPYWADYLHEADRRR